MALGDAQLALSALAGLRAAELEAAATALAGFCEHAWRSPHAADVVADWLERRQL